MGPHATIELDPALIRPSYGDSAEVKIQGLKLS